MTTRQETRQTPDGFITSTKTVAEWRDHYRAEDQAAAEALLAEAPVCGGCGSDREVDLDVSPVPFCGSCLAEATENLMAGVA